MATSRIKTPLKIAADGGQHDTGDVEFSFVRKSICHDFLLANYGADLSFIGNGNCNGTAVKCQQSIGTHTPPLKKCVAHGSHRKEECCRGARSKQSVEELRRGGPNETANRKRVFDGDDVFAFHFRVLLARPTWLRYLFMLFKLNKKRRWVNVVCIKFRIKAADAN
jgi:hypothetical protein